MMKKIIVVVKPGSKKGPLVEEGSDGTLTVFVRERAVDGGANEAVVKLVAKYFGVAKSLVEITKGQTSKTKTVQIIGR